MKYLVSQLSDIAGFINDEMPRCHYKKIQVCDISSDQGLKQLLLLHQWINQHFSNAFDQHELDAFNTWIQKAKSRVIPIVRSPAYGDTQECRYWD